MAGGATSALPDAPAYMLRGVNLFASGVYRGKKWGPQVIRQMAENAKRLGPSGENLHTPPAAPGHDDDDGWQKFVGEVDAPGPAERTDEPAAGWIDPDSVHCVPDPKHKGHLILRGDIVNVPPEMAAKIRSGEYRFGSAEIYDDFETDMGERRGKVVRKFSYLGNMPPQVKRLGPLPTPEPMPAVKRFSERADGRRVILRERFVRRGQTIHTYAETVSMDRQAMMAALQQAMPGVAQATLDALSDEQLADLVKNLPSPTAAAPAPAAAGAMPAATPFAEGDESGEPAEPSDAEPTREDMIGELVEMGAGEAAELEAMTDEELAALWEEMTSDAGDDDSAGAGEPPADTFADPMTASREELIAELVAMGQDAAQLEAMPEEELRALAAELMGGGEPAAPAPAPAPVPAAMMSERKRRAPKPQPRTRQVVTMSEAQRIHKKARQLESALDASLHQLKRQDAEKFCERLVEEGKATPALVAATILPDLLRLDNTRRVHKFADGGRTRTLSAYEMKKAALAKLPAVFRYGEKFPKGAADEVSADAERAKVERFAETLPAQHRRQVVATFAEIQKKDPKVTAKEALGPTANV